MAARKADVAGQKVRDSQGVEVARMARSKGIARDQFQGALSVQIPRVLDAIKRGERIKAIPAIQYPSWGDVVFVDDVPVRLDQEWQAAINEAGPETPTDYAVQQMGYLYLPTGTGIVRADFVLVPLFGASYRQALGWAAQYEVPYASPRHVFALAKHKPALQRELGMDPAYVGSPVEQACMGGAQMCGVWFNGGRREAHASWAQLGAYARAWVAFLRE